jgi:hypothetical protein
MPVKPTESEDEYIKRQEIEQLREARRRTAHDTERLEKQRLRELHWMRCPKCGMELAEVDFKGVTVDACFACGGMFLDHGEIDKVLEHKEAGWLDRMASGVFGTGKGRGL